MLSDGVPRSVQCVLSAPDQGRARFQIFSRPATSNGAADSWTLHAAGNVRISRAAELFERRLHILTILPARPDGCNEELPVETLYGRFESLGISFGAMFRACPPPLAE